MPEKDRKLDSKYHSHHCSYHCWALFPNHLALLLAWKRRIAMIHYQEGATKHCHQRLVDHHFDFRHFHCWLERGLEGHHSQLDFHSEILPLLVDFGLQLLEKYWATLRAT